MKRRQHHKKAITKDLTKFYALQDQCGSRWWSVVVQAQEKEIPVDSFPCRECRWFLTCLALGRTVLET